MLKLYSNEIIKAKPEWNINNLKEEKLQFKHYFKLDSSFLSYNSLKNHTNKVIYNIPKNTI
jgi:hypothetical protein